MKLKSLLAVLSIAALCAFSLALLAGCDDDDPTEPEATPTATPLPTATPTPDAGPGPWISGRAVVSVIGATIPPDDDHDKGVIFSLDGPSCESAWTRLRNRKDLGGRADYQSKAVGDSNYPDECWAEINYYLTEPAADGEWIVTWAPEGRGSVITFFAPNGTSQTLRTDYVLAFNRVTTSGFGCVRPPLSAGLNVSLVSFEPTASGNSEDC